MFRARHLINDVTLLCCSSCASLKKDLVKKKTKSHRPGVQVSQREEISAVQRFLSCSQCASLKKRNSVKNFYIYIRWSHAGVGVLGTTGPGRSSALQFVRVTKQMTRHLKDLVKKRLISYGSKVSVGRDPCHTTMLHFVRVTKQMTRHLKRLGEKTDRTGHLGVSGGRGPVIQGFNGLQGIRVLGVSGIQGIGAQGIRGFRGLGDLGGQGSGDQVVGIHLAQGIRVTRNSHQVFFRCYTSCSSSIS